MLHGTKRVVQFLYYRIVHTTVVYQMVTFQLSRIVKTNLIFNVHITDSCIRGYQVGLLAGIRQVVFDKISQTKLGFQFHGIGIVLLRFVHIHACRGSDVHNLILLLERFQVGFHVSQFTLNDDKTLIDKVGGIHSHLVFLLDGLFIVHRNQCI